MAIPRHNAHMKITKHVWDRARTCSILAGKSMTEFTEEALSALSDSQNNHDEEDEDERVSDSAPAGPAD